VQGLARLIGQKGAHLETVTASHQSQGQNLALTVIEETYSRILDMQGQILASAFRAMSFQPFRVFPLRDRSTAVLYYGMA